jgi:UDP-glucose 4-epimerase
VTVLVTGAAGFFGSAIVRSLALDGHDVVAFDRTPEQDAQTRPDTPPGRVGYVVGDVTDRGTLEPTRFDGVTGIVHAAALSLPNETEMAAAILDVNVRGTVNVLELAGQLPQCDRFLQVSSAGVYDLGRRGVVNEADATGGRSLYGATKLASETLAIRVGEVIGFDVGIVRPSSLWGPGELERPTRPFVTPIQKLVSCARRGEPVAPQGLDAAWDWIYVDDAAEGVARFFAMEMAGRCLTLASGRGTPFRDVVAAVMEVFDLQVRTGGTTVDGSPDRPANLSIEALASATGWRPETTLIEGLTRYRTFLDETARLAPSRAQAAPSA